MLITLNPLGLCLKTGPETSEMLKMISNHGTPPGHPQEKKKVGGHGSKTHLTPLTLSIFQQFRAVLKYRKMGFNIVSVSAVLSTDFFFPNCVRNCWNANKCQMWGPMVEKTFDITNIWTFQQFRVCFDIDQGEWTFLTLLQFWVFISIMCSNLQKYWRVLPIFRLVWGSHSSKTLNIINSNFRRKSLKQKVRDPKG